MRYLDRFQESWALKKRSIDASVQRLTFRGTVWGVPISGPSTIKVFLMPSGMHGPSAPARRDSLWIRLAS